MRRWFLLTALLLLLSGCSGCHAGDIQVSQGEPVTEEVGTEETATAEPVTQADPGTGPQVWTQTELPVHLQYGRLWEYGVYADTGDPALIADVVNALSQVRVLSPTDMGVTDYTDLLTFTFADGRTLTLEFEADIWVADREHRYTVEGLSALRRTLDALVQGDE